MSPIVPSRYGHPKYNVLPQKSRAASLGGSKQNQRGTPGFDSKSRRKQRVEESKITVQPNEEEEGGDNFFSKQLASARFQNNHKLIHVLFSDAVVEPDHVSEAEKIQNCKKRHAHLSEFQKKLDLELLELSERFSQKKLKITSETERYAVKLDENIAKSKKDLEILRAEMQQEAIVRQFLHDIVAKIDEEPETKT